MKKGFTMVELLAVIVILGILAVAGIVGVQRLIDRSKQEEQIQYSKTLKMAAESYYQANQSQLPKAIGEKKRIDAATLKSKNYLKSDIKDTNGKTCMGNSYVEVYKETTTKYSYKAIVCGKGKTPEEKTEPVVERIYFTDSTGARGQAVYKNVRAAKIIIKINGGTTEEGEELEIDGYSYAISVKKQGSDIRTEVYNTGTLSGNGYRKISIDRNVTDFIDVSGVTELYAKVTVRNSAGNTTESNTDAEGTYNDKDRPVCKGLLTDEVKEDDWIDKDRYLSGERRTVTVKCDDGKGSGCLRERFSRSWPNEEQKTGAEYGYVQTEDNVGLLSVDNNYLTDHPCDKGLKENDCRVRVNVDIESPTIKVEGAYKRKNSTTNEKEGENRLTNKKEVTDKSANTTGAIASNEYTTKTLNEGWMNNNNYPNGVVYEINLSDNIHLASWTWETNQAYATDTNSEKYKKVSLENPDHASGKIEKTSEDSINCGKQNKTIYVRLAGEGKRKGVLTVYDQAGNKTSVTIAANIDRTAPPVPKDMTYSPNIIETWTNKEIKATVPTANQTDKESGNTTLSGWNYFQYNVTRYNGNTVSAKKGELVFNKDLEGKNELQFRSCDKAENCSKYSSAVKIWVDFTKPKCDVTLSTPGKNGNGWQGIGENATVTATCNEEEGSFHSGCVTKPFSKEYNSNTYTSAAGAQGIGKGGSVKDKAGNVQDCDAKKTVHIDHTAPKCSTTGASNKWARARTITRGCTDQNNVKASGGSGCTEESITKYKYAENTAKVGSQEVLRKSDNKIITTVNFGEYTIKDNADNSVKCAATANVNVYVDRLAPNCTGDKSPNTSGSASANGVTIKWSCNDQDSAKTNGSGVDKCPATTKKAKSNQDITFKDKVGNVGHCKMTVKSRKQYRYIKKNKAGTCTSSCCGYKTCRHKNCGCQTYNKKDSCGYCGYYFAYDSFSWSGWKGSKSCPAGYPHRIRCNYQCKNCEHGNGGYDQYNCYCGHKTTKCKSCRNKAFGCQTYKSCATSGCGNRTCTSVRCCGYVCGSSWGSWGGSSTGCKSDMRYLYY